ncbi:DUF2971 domain-containing protein [Pseudomonas aeruginosa]
MLLYHYTDANGLLGIIRNKSLWATHIEFLNDSMEFHSGINSINDLCEELEKAYRDSEDDVQRESSSLYPMIRNFVYDNLTNRNLYTTSLTKSKDNLRQWMAYCPPNGGYAIAFNKEKILISGEDQRHLKVVCRLEDVDYHRKKLREFLDVDAIVECIQRNNFNPRLAGAELVHKILFHCCAIKEAEFENEEETRLVVQSSTKKDHRSQFRTRSGVIIPYFDYPIELDWIEEIIIGPTHHMELAQQGLKELLHKNNMSCNVIKSKCSLRVL